jgi:hypothetical protein
MGKKKIRKRKKTKRSSVGSAHQEASSGPIVVLNAVTGKQWNE